MSTACANTHPMIRGVLVAIYAVGLAILPGLPLARAQAPVDTATSAPAWPREVKSSSDSVLMYEPQFENVTENEVEARAAIQVTPTGKPAAFGAVWISARVNIDRDARLVTFRDIRIARVRFVDASDAEKAALSRLLEEQMPTWNLQIGLDQFIPLVDLARHESPRDVGLKHDPPRIIIASEPTTLVVLDGPARQQVLTTPDAAAKDKLERVVNTPALIFYHPGRKQYFLAGGGDLWYSATSATGPYSPATNVPPAVAALVTKSASEDVTSGTPPKVIVATEPAEIIVLAGTPQYVPIGDVDLLAVSNADTDIIVTLGTRAHYVVLSGRWYVSRNGLEGPWTFVPPGELPVDFARIPEKSEHAHLRAHVPGTVEAQEALLDNTIPETQAIRRDDSSLMVTYDGAPVFKDVEGAQTLQYAANTPQSVFKLGNRYYACEQGVWYESSAATGPWTVSTSIPKEIYSIPASNPHHNVTYVKVYDVTPKVVYVGYTPGYVGSFPYGGCVVFGTGWHYPGWYGQVYYPYPATWGFRATYNPYYGWGYGVGWSSGPLTVSIRVGPPRPPGWWGPWGYRPYYPPYPPPYFPGYRPPHYPGYYPPGYPGYRPPPGGVRPGTPMPLPSNPRTRPADASIYRRGGNVARNLPETPGNGRPTTPTTRPNDVYAAPNGDVFRRNPSGQWDQRSSGNWSPSPGAGGDGGRPATPATRPAPGTDRPNAPTTRPAPGTGQPNTPTTRPAAPSGGLNRDFAARQRGTTRSGSAPGPAPRAGRGR